MRGLDEIKKANEDPARAKLERRLSEAKSNFRAREAKLAELRGREAQMQRCLDRREEVASVLEARIEAKLQESIRLDREFEEALRLPFDPDQDLDKALDAALELRFAMDRNSSEWGALDKCQRKVRGADPTLATYFFQNLKSAETELEKAERLVLSLETALERTAA